MLRLTDKRGFTLIEIAIVLAIVGLVVSGILVGRNLIRASEAKAMLTQLNAYSTAVTLFESTYQAAPGDISALKASRFGFAPRGVYAGQGDGNGVIQGVNANADNANNGTYESAGETLMFWSDLTYANGLNINLVPGVFTLATLDTPTDISSTQLGRYLPAARIGNGNYVYAYSNAGQNYFGVSQVQSIAANGQLSGSSNIPVATVYSMDSKVDDGLPTSGNFTAFMVGTGPQVGTGAFLQRDGRAMQAMVRPAPHSLQSRTRHRDGLFAFLERALIPDAEAARPPMVPYVPPPAGPWIAYGMVWSSYSGYAASSSCIAFDGSSSFIYAIAFAGGENPTCSITITM